MNNIWNGEEIQTKPHIIRRGFKEGQYLVQSSTDHKIYEIDILNKDNPHPDCKGFFYRNTCSHWEACLEDYRNINIKK